MSGPRLALEEAVVEDKPPDKDGLSLERTKRVSGSSSKASDDRSVSSAVGSPRPIQIGRSSTDGDRSEERCSTPKDAIEGKRINLQSKIARLQHQALMKAQSDSDSDYGFTRKRTGSDDSSTTDKKSDVGRRRLADQSDRHGQTATTSDDSESSATELDVCRSERRMTRRKSKPRKKHRHKDVVRDSRVAELTRAAESVDSDSASYMSDRTSSPGPCRSLSPERITPPPSVHEDEMSDNDRNRTTSRQPTGSESLDHSAVVEEMEKCRNEENSSSHSLHIDSPMPKESIVEEKAKTLTDKSQESEGADVIDTDRAIQCKKCQQTLANVEKLQEHVRHKHTVFPCKLCPTRYIGSLALEDHVFEVHLTVDNESRPRYKCEICSKSFTNARLLQSHGVVHVDQRPYKCDLCPRTFERRRGLETHVRGHRDVKPFRCRICETSFGRRIQLLKHKRKFHPRLPDPAGYEIHLPTLDTGRESLLEETVDAVSKAKCSESELGEFLKMEDCHDVAPDHVTLAAANSDACQNSTNRSWPLEDTAVVNDIGISSQTTHETKAADSLVQPDRVEVTVAANELIEPSQSELESYDCNGYFKTETESEICTEAVNILNEIQDDPSQTFPTLDSQFKCFVCEIVFEDSDALALHKRTHHDEEKPHGCGTCGERFLAAKSLRSHVERHHASRTCDVCSQHVEGTEGLRKHKYSHQAKDPSKPHQCKICFKSFTTARALRVHLKIHDVQASFACDFCPKTFNRRSSLNEHNLAHRGQRAWVCQACPRKFTRSTSLRHHMVALHPELPPLTPSQKAVDDLDIDRLLATSSGELDSQPVSSLDKQRTRSVTSESQLIHDVHNALETQQTTSAISSGNLEGQPVEKVVSNSLETRNTTSGSEAELDVKMEVESIATNGDTHGNGEADREDIEMEADTMKPEISGRQASETESRHVCQYCGKCFTRNNSLQLHIQIHTGKKFQCEACPMRFTNVYEMNRHTKTVHNGERPYACLQCPERFVCVSTLRNHLVLVHEGTKCDVCGAEVDGTEALRVHKRTHAPVDSSKPHQCETCFKRFKKRLALKVHSKIHDPNFVFKCQYCPKTFNRKQSMTEHMRVHTGEQMWACEVCGRKFTRRPSLRDHMVRHHPKVAPTAETVIPAGPARRVEPLAVVNGTTQTVITTDDNSTAKVAEGNHISGRNEQSSLLDPADSAAPSLKVKDETESLRSNTPQQSERTASPFGSESSRDIKLPFACTACHFRYASVAELVMHKQMNHQNQKPYSCKECRETYVDVLSLRNHLDRVHTIQICDICSEQVNGTDTLRVHRNSHFDAKDLPTGIDGRDFAGLKPFKCHLCAETFQSHEFLEEHVSDEHAEKWPCQLCDGNFVRTAVTPNSHLSVCRARNRKRKGRKRKHRKEEKVVQKQVQNENGTNLLEGRSPSVLSVKKSSRKAPSLDEGDQNPSKKSRLSKRASSWATETEPSKAEGHTCEYCGKSFSRNASLARHRQSHTGKHFPCDQCPLQFTNSYVLSEHVRTSHRVKRPHSCHECNRKFISLPSLRSHVDQFHSEQKKRDNDLVCSRQLILGKTVLNVHRDQSVESDPSKPFRCQTCYEYFRTRLELGVHEQVHDNPTDEQTLACPTCGKRFKRQTSYDQHVRLDETGKVTACRVRDKDFSRRTSLRDRLAKIDPALVDENDNDKTKTSLRENEVKDSTEKRQPDVMADTTSPDDLADTVSLDGETRVNGNSNGEAEELKCSICDQVFTRRDRLEAHEFMHAQNGPFKSTECKKDFKRREQFSKHLLEHKRSDECQAECLQCGREFMTPAALERHLVTHRETKPQSLCGICGKGFLLRYELLKHKRTVHLGLKDFGCHTCTRRFTSCQGLKAHEKLAHGRGNLASKRFQCPVCSKDFLTKTRLTNHVRSHSGEKPYQCTICNLRFRIKVNLDRHAFKHDPSKRFNCEECQKFFSRKSHLLVHRAKIHDVEIFRCPYCPFERYFQTLDELQSHKADVHPLQLPDEEPGFHLSWEKKPKLHPFVCDLCPKTFGSRTNLVHHRRIHTDDRPFACDVCRHRSVSKSSLKTHRLTHTDAKPYACQFCAKAFGREWVLKRHVLTRHTDCERPHKCDQCEKTFRRPVELTQHVFKLHSGVRERLHECVICRKRFYELQQLTDHFSTHESDGEFCCEFCLVPFPKKSLLETHAKTHQNNNLRPYQCFLCKQAYADRTGLQAHLGEHEQAGLCQCPFCARVFRQIGNLLGHMITHSGLRSDKLKFFECEPCQRTFWRFDSYQEHRQQAHDDVPDTNEGANDENSFDSLMTDVPDTPMKPSAVLASSDASRLMCSFCGKEFSRKYTLDRHIKCHTNDRPYKCQVCAVRFIAKYDLTLHMRRHNKEKPFACKVCGKAYEVAYRLAGHMKNSKDSEHRKAYLLTYAKTATATMP